MYIWNYKRALEIYTADSVYTRMMTESKSVSLDHNDGEILEGGGATAVYTLWFLLLRLFL
jgi:ribulose-5-phosphate 4-epimerase/fuculose-1-phosphate aldolase